MMPPKRFTALSPSHLRHLLSQSLLGLEEPLPGRGRRPLQLSGVVVPADASVLPEELRQRGFAAPERPLLVLLSGKSEVSQSFVWLAAFDIVKGKKKTTTKVFGFTSLLLPYGSKKKPILQQGGQLFSVMMRCKLTVSPLDNGHVFR